MSKKKDIKKQQDENLESVEHALTRSEEFIEKNQKQLTIGLLVIVAIVAIVMGYNRFILQPKEKEAQSQMFMGEQYFAVDSFRLAINGDGNFMGFEYIMDEYGITKAGSLAAYYTGISYMHLGEYELAIENLKQFDGGDKMVTPVAYGAMGDCYMELEDYDNAISEYKKAVEYENDFTTPIHLKKLGIAYNANGETKTALEAFEQIKEKYSQSTEARDIDKLIALIKE